MNKAGKDALKAILSVEQMVGLLTEYIKAAPRSGMEFERYHVAKLLQAINLLCPQKMNEILGAEKNNVLALCNTKAPSVAWEVECYQASFKPRAWPISIKPLFG
jgi:hypothetical protein